MSVSYRDPAQDGWTPTSKHRSGGIEIKQLFSRDSGVGGMEMTVVQFGREPFFSPPHKHGFDQIRIGLEGVTTYGRFQLGPRVIGYFPAGVTYGPQTVEEPSLQSILQFDGTGDGVFCPLASLDAATERLRPRGLFEKGYFTPTGGERQEAWQATFREATGREPFIPDARYPEPVFLNIDAFPWTNDDRTGVKRKVLGRFCEPVTTLEVLAAPKGKSVRLGAAKQAIAAFVLSGRVRVEGDALGAYSGLMLEEGDHADVAIVSDEAELVVVTLPEFRA